MREIEEYYDLQILVICRTMYECNNVRRFLLESGEFVEIVYMILEDKDGHKYFFATEDTLIRGSKGRRVHQIFLAGTFTLNDFYFEPLSNNGMSFRDLIIPCLSGSEVPKDFLVQRLDMGYEGRL